MASATIVCPSCSTRNRLPVVAKGRLRCAKCRTDLPWLVDVSASEFAPVVSTSTLPVLVDLWAPWCGPCRTIAPALVQLAGERAGSLRIAKVNVDDAPGVSESLHVKGIPTMVLFRDGKEIARQVGAVPLASIRTWLDGALATR